MLDTRDPTYARSRHAPGCVLLALIFALGPVARVQAQSAEVSSISPVEETSFVPTPGSLAHISVEANLTTVTLKSGGRVSTEKIIMDTEQKITVQVADYNFDGYQDFSLSHTDDGKGTYQIYKIYVFSSATKKFEQLMPGCGDDFINVVLSKPEQRRLTNSYSSAGTWKSCTKIY
jgi:hypothetical protein